MEFRNFYGILVQRWKNLPQRRLALHLPSGKFFLKFSVVFLVLITLPDASYTLRSIAKNLSRPDTNFSQTLKHVSTPGDGINILPHEVLEMKKILEKIKTSTYGLSARIKNDDILYQRVIEGLWPVKNEASSFVFLRADEQLPTTCSPVAQSNEVKIAFCPR